MKRKKIYLKYKKERAVLSDVLPYETPITFSNRHFYEFLLKNKVHYKEGFIKWEKGDDALEIIIRLLFGAGNDAGVITNAELIDGNCVNISSFSKVFHSPTIPFNFKISHKENEHRELSVIHPLLQIRLIDLYAEYKELIIYYCSQSDFSIRRPAKIAKYIYHKDKTHNQKLSRDNEMIEEFHMEYENLRSFFSYKDYSNVYKFYESYQYHRCEKKYDALMKLDISKCFDSIYSHSISWALIGSEQVKESLKEKKLSNTFADKFDKFMQSSNYQETNGIIIGPEFSRIFAELILQHIDKKLLIKLKAHKIFNKNHYQIFRYVDDYFVFYNDETVINLIQQELQVILKEFKLSFNPAKAEVYKKPLITNISIAKIKIAELLGKSLEYQFEDSPEEINGSDDGSDSKKSYKGNIFVNSNKLITKFKTIIKETGVEYKDLQNYTLSVVERKCANIIRDYEKLETADIQKNQKSVVKAILNILDFSYFIYSVSPRVNTTIKLCRITKIFTDFMKREDRNVDLKHIVFKTIYDKTRDVLKKNKNTVYTQVETLYLLIMLAELGKYYLLEEETLCEYLCIDIDNEVFKHQLNYFSFTVLLFYIRSKKRYRRTRELLENNLCARFNRDIRILRKDTELTLLLFDMLACPYINIDTKRILLSKYGVTDPAIQTGVIEKRNNWFTKWTEFDLAKELDAKRSSEVY